MPKVSVIIPVYNVEKYIRECLDSVLGQTLTDIQVICVDDGSADESLSILYEYKQKDTRVQIYTQKNCGAGAARNIGMKHATGEYLFFMDSDDFCEKDFFENAYNYAKDKEADITVFDYYTFNNCDKSTELKSGVNKGRIPFNKDVFSYKDAVKDICLAVNPMPWNKFFSHDFVRETGLKWLETSTTNDVTFSTMAVLMARRIYYVEQPYVYYRVELNNSITGRKKYNQNNVIKAVLSVAEQAEKLDYFNEVKSSIKEFILINLYTSLKAYTPDENSAQHIEFKKKIESIVFSHPIFLDLCRDDCKDEQIYRNTLSSFSQGAIRRDFSFSPEIIVSLTSFPERIKTVYKALASIYNQTLIPDKVVLWLSEEQFPKREEQLPIELLDYKYLGLEIRWCKDDLRPHKKYYYAMQEFPQSIIITVDDDLIYDPLMIETLFASYLNFPHAVSTMRTHLILPNQNGDITTYSDWQQEFTGIIGVPSMQLFSTSGAGTLYPPNCMDNEVFNIGKIKQLSLNADDLWLKIMQVRKGTPVVLVKEYTRIKYIPGTQSVALAKTNLDLNENDVQLANILNEYDKSDRLKDIILADGYTAESQFMGKDLFKDNGYGLLQANSINAIYLSQTEKELIEKKRIENELKILVSELRNKNKNQADELYSRYQKIIDLNKEKAERYEKILSLNSKISEQKSQILKMDSKISEQRSKIVEQETKISQQTNQISTLEKKVADEQRKLDAILNSRTYKIGKLIIYIPKKIINFFKRK